MKYFEAHFLDKILFYCKLLSRSVEAVAGWFVICCGSAMLIVILLQVIFRYVIKGSLPWSEEVSRYLMIWIGFVGGSLAFRYGEFIGIEVLRNKLTPGGSRVLEVVISVSVILFLSFLVVFGIDFALKGAIQRSAVLRIKMTYAYMSIPIGAAFCLVHAVVFLLEQLRFGESARADQG